MKSAKPSIMGIYSGTFSAVAKNPKVYLPFVIFAGLESLCLVFIYFLPHQPLVALFGPPIATFWGSRYLHYPFYFLLLPKLASLARMWLAVLAGSLLTGSAVCLVYKKPVRIAFKKYIALFLIVLFTTALFYFANKFAVWVLMKYFTAGHAKLLFIGPRWWFGPILISANFSIALVIQALFIYSIPALMLDAKLLSALAQSITFCLKNIVMSLVLVGAPMLAYIPIIILNANAAYLIDRLFPEVTFLIVIAGALISSLVIDAIMTVSTALAYQSSQNT